MKRILCVLMLLTISFTYTTLDLRAATIQTAQHSMSTQEMHRAIETSNQRMNATRESVQDFFARSDIRAQIQRFGFAPERISSHVAMLSDSELNRLNLQIMEMDSQRNAAGLSKGAIWAIVLGGVALLAIVIWLEVRAVDDLNAY